MKKETKKVAVVGKPVMSVVKDVTKVQNETETALNQLKLILYRKEMAEHEINTLLNGANIYVEYCDQLKLRMAGGKMTPGALAQCKKDLHANEWEARKFIQSYNEIKREYNHHIIPAIEEVMNKANMDKSSVKFVDTEALAKELAATEIYGKVTLLPENVELQNILKDYKEYMSIIKDLVVQLKKKLKGETDPLEMAILKKEIFDNERSLITLEKRYNRRVDYYHNEFLPRYKEEMKEAKRLLSKYLERGRELVKLGVDPKLYFLLDEYENHKNEGEKTWLFYTALKSRVDQIIQFINDNPHLHKDTMHLGQKIV